VTLERIPELMAVATIYVCGDQALWTRPIRRTPRGGWSRAEQMNDTIDVTVNGEPRSVARGATLLALLESLALDPRAVVVEHNRTIVRRPRLAAVTVAPGDAMSWCIFVGE